MLRRLMRLLFVTPEVTPYSGTTPTGDACWALPKALKARGHEVTVLSPLYGFIDPSARSLARRLRKIPITLGEEKHSFEVYDARTAAGVDLLFLGHEQWFRSVKALPTGDDPDDGLRYGAFCKGAIEVLRSDERGYDVVHCHDWGAGLTPVLVSLHELEVPTVMTVHDVRRQGIFSPDLVTRLGLPPELFSIDGIEFWGKTNLLKGGVLEADRVTTVSPTYAREIAERDGALGLEGVFRERGKELSGIAGGVDMAVWNPATDAHLEARFDPMDRTGKRRSKAALQRDVGLPIRDDVPLIGVIGQLHPNSGLDVLARIVGRLMRNDAQVVVVSDAEPSDESLVAVLTEHQGRWPDRLQVRAQATPTLVHRAIAGSDAVLVAPRQAPGGSMQMRAHRYGALPIGLAAGSVADTVVDCDAKLATGTGFLFTSAADEAVLAAVQRAIGAYSNRPAFEKVRARAMRADHSWERCAYLHERLYEAM
jgi:starch synthase